MSRDQFRETPTRQKFPTRLLTAVKNGEQAGRNCRLLAPLSPFFMAATVRSGEGEGLWGVLP